MISEGTPIWQLTVGQFKELIKETSGTNTSKEPTIINENEHVYGIGGLAELIGVSKTTAQKLKSSGIINEAITQVGRKIIINKKITLQILKSKSL